MKRCSRCKSEKSESEFYRRVTSSDGLQSQCKVCVCEACYEYRKQNKRKIYDRRLQREYGISIDDYDRMATTQGHKCAICGGQNLGKNRSRFDVDHDHVTGQVRALLCGKCNQGIGLMQDDPDLLEKAADYIRAFQGNR